MKLSAILSLLAILTTGCATHYIQYSANTEPPANWVYPEGGSRSSTSYYRQRLSTEDIQKGKLQLPRLVFEARGHKPYVFTPGELSLATDSFIWDRRYMWQEGNNIIHGVKNTQSISLIPDPKYDGPETPNKLQVSINSEPPGVRIYQNGRLFGTTPTTIIYTLQSHNYRSGQVRGNLLTAAADGYLPVEFTPEIPVEGAWKYQSGQTFESDKGILFVLRRDPNDNRPVVIQQAPAAPSGQQTVVIKQDPHYGRQWETGMRALGDVIRPHSKADPITTEQNIRALQGYGTLIDLMNR